MTASWHLAYAWLELEVTGKFAELILVHVVKICITLLFLSGSATRNVIQYLRRKNVVRRTVLHMTQRIVVANVTLLRMYVQRVQVLDLGVFIEK